MVGRDVFVDFSPALFGREERGEKKKEQKAMMASKKTSNEPKRTSNEWADKGDPLFETSDHKRKAEEKVSASSGVVRTRESKLKKKATTG